MDNEDINYDTQNIILDTGGGDSSHVVLTKIPSTKNKMRRRTNATVSQSEKNQQRTGQTPPRPPKRIPQWLWMVISKSLGIKTRPREKPYLSSILHLLTLGSATRKSAKKSLNNTYLKTIKIIINQKTIVLNSFHLNCSNVCLSSIICRL